MSFDIVKFTTSGAVATNGTVTVSYPTARTIGDYTAEGHKARISGMAADLSNPSGFTLTFNSGNITFTYKGTTSIPANAQVTLQLNLKGADADVAKRVLSTTKRAGIVNEVLVRLGAPVAAAAAGVAASQALNTGVDGVLTSTIVTLDVPRNIVAAWTNTAVITVTGTDEYGNVIVESSASGTSFAGKKAFKTVTKVRISANATGLTVGWGDVLGLPIFLAGTGYVIRELQDGASPTAGTIVKGDLTAATATTGDVRGTYDPNAAADGAKAFDLVIIADDVNFKGVSQFAG